MVFMFIFEISDLHHLPSFLTIFSQNCNFFEELNELSESVWKEFWAKLPVCIIGLSEPGVALPEFGRSVKC